MTFTHALSTNNYGPAKFIVSPSAANGTHTTITSAMASASSGDTIVIRDGTYTENFNAKAGVALQAFEAGGLVGNILIDGTITYSQAGTSSLVGIKFQNSSSQPIITVSGSNACTLDVQDCIFNSASASFFLSVSNTNASTVVKLFDCEGDISASSQAIFSCTNGASIEMYNCFFTNSIASTAVSSNTLSGNLKLYGCAFKSRILVGNTANLDIQDSIIDCSAINSIALLADSSGTNSAFRCSFLGGTASAVIVQGVSAVLTIDFCIINSSNTNAITGTGTISYGTLDFTGSSSTINTSTQTALNTQVGSLLIKTPITLSSPVPMMRDSVTGAVGTGSTSVVTTYTSNGTYTVNPNAKTVEFYVWGGGGGGGSGRCGATTAAGGGGGGGGGGFSYAKTLASLLIASPYTVTVGGSANGGASINATNTDGNPGTVGNASSVVGVIVAPGGGLGPAGTNGSAIGGASSLYISPSNLNTTPIASGGNGQKGGVGVSSSDLTYGWTTGGAGGSGYATGTARTGARAGNILDGAGSVLVLGGLAGSNAGATAGNGNAPTGQSLMIIGGTGGGSGGNDGVSTAGAGGNGVQPGGGGGGGSGILSANASGAGGNGAAGQVIIIEYF